MINGEIITISRTIVDSMKNDRMTIDGRRHLDNVNIIQKVDTSPSPSMFGDRNMKMEKPVGPRNQFFIFVEKMGTMQINIQ